MASQVGDASAQFKNHIRKLQDGGDTGHDQVRKEADQVLKVLLDNFAVLFPAAADGAGVVSMEVVVLAGAETYITLAKPVTTLYGAVGFVAANLIVDDLGITGWTPDVDQVTNPGKVAIAGAAEAGNLVVFYV